MSSLNFTDVTLPYSGWVSSSRDRGSIDILWSCCFTVLLCCWVATHPNATAPLDTAFHRFLDKLYLAMIGLLGPDFLFAIALGQFSSAWRSVKAFKQETNTRDGAEWTFAHAFLADMGGIYLASPDFDNGFPVTAEQLHYLVIHDHIEFPKISRADIKERNTVDTLSRFLTLCQILWFSVKEFHRVREGFPMTTLELTALSFVMMMLATGLLWFNKPSPTKPRIIQTKNSKTIQEIRTYAKEHTHHHLEQDWYQTPLTFIDGERFQIDTHWSYYTRLAMNLHLMPPRQITARPWDRIPSDKWMPCEKALIPPCSIILMAFSSSFIPAWNFFFPTPVEKTLWRVVSVYHACFGFFGGLYYLIETLRWHCQRSLVCANNQAMITSQHSTLNQPVTGRAPTPSTQPTTIVTPLRLALRYLDTIMEQRSLSPFIKGIKAGWVVATGFITSFRNTSPDQDPTLTLRIRLLIPITITCIIYVFCRFYIYIEEFYSLREQPVGVYIAVNRFLPFLGR